MEILHNQETSTFSVTIDGRASRLVYRVNEGVFDIRSTYVPDELRGRGIASELVKTACDYAKEHNFKIIASCSYAVAWIKRHPEYDATVGPDYRDDACTI